MNFRQAFLNLNYDRMIAALKVCKHGFIENKAPLFRQNVYNGWTYRVF